LRITLLISILMFSVPAYSDCSCEGNVYLHLIFQDRTDTRHDVRVFGSNWPSSVAANIDTQESFKKLLEGGASFEIVTASTTLPFKTKKHGVVRAPFVVRTGKRLDTRMVRIVERVELIKAGCAAYPSPVRKENMNTLTKSKPVKVEVRNDKKYGGITYRVFFKKNEKLIWLRYSPELVGNCPKSIQSNNKSASKSKTHFVCNSVPFIGYYAGGEFSAIRAITKLSNSNPEMVEGYDFTPIDRFTRKVPTYFSVGTPVKTIGLNGNQGKTKIEKLDTQNLGEIIVNPPVLYSNNVQAQLAWTSNLELETVKTIPKEVPAEVYEELKKKLQVQIRNLLKSFKQGNNSEALKKMLNGNYPAPVALSVKGLDNILHIHWMIELSDYPRQSPNSVSNYFIYSLSKKKFILDSMRLMAPYDSPNGTSMNPLFFFKIDGDSSTYLLVNYFDGYENRTCQIVDSETGKVMLETY